MAERSRGRPGRKTGGSVLRFFGGTSFASLPYVQKIWLRWFKLRRKFGCSDEDGNLVYPKEEHPLDDLGTDNRGFSDKEVGDRSPTI
jgi:hypothetical protein